MACETQSWLLRPPFRSQPARPHTAPSLPHVPPRRTPAEVLICPTPKPDPTPTQPQMDLPATHLRLHLPARRRGRKEGPVQLVRTCGWSTIPWGSPVPVTTLPWVACRAACSHFSTHCICEGYPPAFLASHFTCHPVRPCRFATSRRLLTPPRLAFATAGTAGVLLAALPAAQAAAVAATVLLATLLSGYYGNLVLGGIVGDYLGATIAVTELAIYLVLAADWQGAAARWQPLAVVAAAAALPVLYTRRVIAAGGASC